MKTVLLIISIILIIYLALLVMNLTFIFAFRTNMKNHNNALKIILNSRLDNVKKMYQILTKHKVKVKSELITDLELIDKDTFGNQESQKCEMSKKRLSYLKESALSLANDNPSVLKDDEYQALVDTIKQLETIYRSTVIMYNADVLGYNYWIRFLPWRYLFLLFKIKEKSVIS